MPERTSPPAISRFLLSVFCFTFLGRDERRFTPDVIPTKAMIAWQARPQERQGTEHDD
jgi:hypothetical protein